MVSVQTSAESIRAAVSSTSTCTPATVSLLSNLLLPETKTIDENTPKVSKSNSGLSEQKRKAKAPVTKTRPKKELSEENAQHQVSLKERSILATEVINSALKALSEAIKSAPATRKDGKAKENVKASTRKPLRRSNSMPQSPLQPRSLNRISSSPSISARLSRSSSSASTSISGTKSVGECARVAFTCLRSLQTSKLSGGDLPPLQIENGMSVLVGKFISLGLEDLAIKELRILKRRLESDNGQITGKKSGIRPRGNPSSISPTLGELLDFGKSATMGSKLGLIITTQLQVLRLITTSRKAQHIQTALPILQLSHPSSPTSLLLLAARDSKQATKVARQLQTLSDLILALSPSISASEDAVALEPRLNVSPEVAIQLQTLALHNRVLWWRLAGHKGDPAKDLLDPFLRCLSAFARRSQRGPLETYRVSSSAFINIQETIMEYDDSNLIPKSILTGIYRLLGSLSQEANLIDEAIAWIEKIETFLDPKIDSDAKRCSVSARLVSLYLRGLPRDLRAEGILLYLLEGLEKPLKGEASEIDDLLTEVSSARRVAIGVLSKTSTSKEDLPKGISQMCKSLVFLCPRLWSRYLGKPPNVDSATKEIVRYEQRRQYVAKSGSHAIDSALFLIKLLMGEGNLSWDLMDTVLQECLSLFDRLETTSDRNSLESGVSATLSYYTRISNLYYTQYLDLRRDDDNSKDSQKLRVLRRSIDCIQSRSRQEKKAALLSMKLERIAEVYKISGRYDEVVNTLQKLRDEVIDDGVLCAIATASSRIPIRNAWCHSDESLVLARTEKSLLKLKLKHPMIASQVPLVEESWSIEEKGAMLEYQMETLSIQASATRTSENLRIKVFLYLSSIYDGSQYPLRRLRVLIRFLCLNTGFHQEEALLVKAELDRCQGIVIQGTRDEGLQNYRPHLQAWADTVLELQRNKPNIDVFKRCLRVWDSIVKRCDSLETLKLEIDDVLELLVHLNSIADYLYMKGFDIARITVLQLIADFNEIRDATSNPDDLVLSYVGLGGQWLQLGYSGKAGLALDRAQNYSHRNGLASSTLLQLHLSYSEYLLAIGNYDKCEEHLLRAQVISAQESDRALTCPVTLAERTRNNQQIATAFLVHSMLALERGNPQLALDHAKQSLRLLKRAWANIEEKTRNRQLPREDDTGYMGRDGLSEGVSQLNLSTNSISMLSTTQCSQTGSDFWPLVAPLFRSLSHLSGVYAHHGMFQETIYYTEQARRLAKDAGSETYLAVALASLGSSWLKAGGLDKGSELLMEIRELNIADGSIQNAVALEFSLGHLHGLLGDEDAEMVAYEKAGMALVRQSDLAYISTISGMTDETEPLEQKMSALSISKKVTVSRKTGGRVKASTKNKLTTPVKLAVDLVSTIAEECPQLSSLRARVLQRKARLFGLGKKYSEAMNLLQEASIYLSSQMDTVNQGLGMAQQLLLQSMEQMNRDPVYSVLQDSTISFPSVVGSVKGDKNVEKLPLTRFSPPKKLQVTRGGRERSGSKSPTPDGFFDKLRQAQEILIEVHALAIAVAPVSVLHVISAHLNSVAIMLSAVGPIKGRYMAHPGFASCSIENARTLSLRRERKAIRADAKINMEHVNWPTLMTSDHRRSSLGFPSHDISRFQRDYIDIIPTAWTAISISLSDNRRELSITKLQSGHSPFILRLPLGRKNSIDADEEIFGFEQGRSELLEIINLANESAHDARDMSSRKAKSAWWGEREALDARLRDLLENIEKVWLGGFSGIFSQHPKRSDLLARFQRSFQVILDKHLPSRRKTGKKSSGPRITLDTRILDLFIGLGYASAEDSDLSEPLTDLLYFVVDVLQFHGELNAYAEIDFDSIVIEIHDALQCYHEAARVSHEQDAERHTILILDKALHSFPWESLPCMDGLAVSRLPSLGCLRERILAQEKHRVEGLPQGHYINRDNGTYILNPGSDLKSTQTTFEKPLSNLNRWDGIVKREPTEAEIKSSLESKDLFLYFGHGSGAQYIRAKEIRKLDKCAVAVLMGCSSGALLEAGEFEPYGTPINYLHAGCPALVATLWDVTDKDIDRFAKKAFEHWGLFGES
ncbi:hypothetical protein B7494_g3918 [Chlorociboria aeruginascens]|nr:hypothetical protein B7494_g3918 [Chlorociboria aeruginascens]